MPKISGVRRSSRLQRRVSDYKNYINAATDRMLEATSSLKLDDNADLVEQFLSFSTAIKVIGDTTQTISREQETIPPHLKTVSIEHCIDDVLESFLRLRSSMRRALSPLYRMIHRIGTFTPPDKVVRRKHVICGVCGDDEEFTVSGRVTLRCGNPRVRHSLCGACFIRWYIVHNESTCPVCRHCHLDEEAHESLMRDLDRTEVVDVDGREVAEYSLGRSETDGRS